GRPAVPRRVPRPRRRAAQGAAHSAPRGKSRRRAGAAVRSGEAADRGRRRPPGRGDRARIQGRAHGSARVLRQCRSPAGPARKMKRLCILGVNGFIGYHLSQRALKDTDWEVYGMDMGSDRIADLLENKRFHFFEGDITINREWIEYHIRKCDVILPLVAIATPATYVREPLKVFELDFSANQPIVRSCVKYQKRILFPSTSEVYGMCGDAEFDPY